MAAILVLSSDQMRSGVLSDVFSVRGARPAGSPVLSDISEPSSTSAQADDPTSEPGQTAETTPEATPSEVSPTGATPPEPTLPRAQEGQVYVPGGTFTMGIAGSEAAPAHQVTLGPFFIDAYEVTNAEWQVCVEANACSEPRTLLNYEGERYYDNPDFANYPVTSITWFEAASYCTWSGGRLPTEAEWEMAARWDPITQELNLYPWGDEPLEGHANTCGAECPLPSSNPSIQDPFPLAAPVGSFEEGISAVGAYDMAGNVAEWVADWFGPYPDGPVTNPTGPDFGERRVVRGGAWGVPLRDTNSVVRSRFTPDSQSVGLGVRCVEED